MLFILLFFKFFDLHSRQLFQVQKCMSLPIKTNFTGIEVLTGSALLIILVLLIFPIWVPAQEKEIFTVTADTLQNEKVIELNKTGWKYHSGDDLDWANPQFDDSEWDDIKEPFVDLQNMPKSGWNGRGWFRLHLKIDDGLANRKLALAATQKGASEIYIDGVKFTDFGKITDTEIVESNPNKLPLPFHFDEAGEHVIAVRFASTTFADANDGAVRWMAHGGVKPGFSMVIRDAPDTYNLINLYADVSSMRIGFFFIGILLALALLHFLLYVFYRVERANLFYSIYAVALAVFLICNNLLFFGHLSVITTVIAAMLANLSFAIVFTALLAFIHVAFGRPLGKFFWGLSALWTISIITRIALINNVGYLGFLTSILIGLSFTFCIFLLIVALREKRSGAWILTVGVQLLALGMTLTLINELNLFDLPPEVFVLGEISIVLAVPIAVSIFLARNFARTNRDLAAQLAQVETLSAQKIEQERTEAELRAENERRAKELEEARQLQLSMLPKKLPNIAGLEIAAYMKPATEVGGDYYDFHVGADGTLTVAVGDATGHGLKAGTVVTATKSLFNNLASAPDIPDTLGQISRSLKAMNLRGLFMAMTMLKIKDKRFSISAAGMPSTIIYRHATGATEEINLRALPLGGIAKTQYSRQEFELAPNDLIVLMSDGFPEMFNPENEMLGFEKAAATLPEIANLSSQEIINELVKIGETWANGRPQDDDVTFVVLKFKPEAANLK